MERGEGEEKMKELKILHVEVQRLVFNTVPDEYFPQNRKSIPTRQITFGISHTYPLILE
jgi:hypothetical protein